MASDTEDKIIVKSEGCTFRWFACIYTFPLQRLPLAEYVRGHALMYSSKLLKVWLRFAQFFHF